MKAIWIGAGLVMLAAVLIFSASGRNDGMQTGQSDFDRLAHISLTDYGGNSVTLENFRNKPLVINSWAVWCPFCRQELPDFAQLQEEFGNQIVVIGIDREEPLGKAKGYTDELGISGKMIFLLDPNDEFYKSIGGFSMPETIFVDTSGSVVFHKRGPLTLEEMRTSVAKYLR